MERCLAGEVAAWEELYAQYHDVLLASVRCFLGQARSDHNLVDEIAARVWYALVANDGALLAKYDPKRGARIITFMRLWQKMKFIGSFVLSVGDAVGSELPAVINHPITRMIRPNLRPSWQNSGKHFRRVRWASLPIIYWL